MEGEKNVLLTSWIKGTLSEEALYLIVQCKTEKEVCTCLEENYLQATSNKIPSDPIKLKDVKSAACHQLSTSRSSRLF